MARLVSSVGLAALFRASLGPLGGGASSASSGSSLVAARSVPDRVALLSYSCISMAQLSVVKTLSAIGKEATVVSRERARGQYRGHEYLLAKIISEVSIDLYFI